MMVRWLIAVVLVAGCTTDAASPSEPRVTLDGKDLRAVLEVETQPDQPDVCGLAAELPSDNICSLVCDPDAIKERLLAEGSKQGTCYEMLCALPGLTVQVGVCLPPPQ